MKASLPYSLAPSLNWWWAELYLFVRQSLHYTKWVKIIGCHSSWWIGWLWWDVIICSLKISSRWDAFILMWFQLTAGGYVSCGASHSLLQWLELSLLHPQPPSHTLSLSGSVGSEQHQDYISNLTIFHTNLDKGSWGKYLEFFSVIQQNKLFFWSKEYMQWYLR